MVEDTMKAIRETEQQADQILRDAGKQCADIRKAAEAKAKETFDAAKAKAEAAAKAKTDAAKAAGEAVRAKAAEDVSAEIGEIRENARTKENEAVDVLLKSLMD